VTWTDITGALPDRFPTDLAIDPFDDEVVYITFSGFGSPHVFASTDGGDSWLDIGGSLPDLPTSAVVVDPADTDRIFIGNDIGVFVTPNRGATWEAYDDGLPEVVAVLDLVFAPDNALRAATHGNGIFERDHPPLFADGFESGDTQEWDRTEP
jgi:hypothetical protein